MIKRLTAACMLLSVLLCGCRLAKEEPEKEAVLPETEDMIVGMLITMDTVEPGAADGLHVFANEGKRLYAELKQEANAGTDGSSGTTPRFAFPEGSGLAYMGYYIAPDMIAAEDPEDGYWASSLDEGIYPEKNHFSTVNEDSFVQLEGIVYVSEAAKDLVLYMNPVFQTESGEVYALGTKPMGYHAVSMYDCSATYSRNAVETENGETTEKDGGYVKMTIRVIQLPDTYRVIQLDADNTVLSCTDWAPEDMPKEVIPSGDCAYILLESCTAGEVTERWVYSPDDASHLLDSYFPLESGICDKGYTTIDWEGAA